MKTGGPPPLIYLCACIIMRHSFFFLSYPLLSRLFSSLHRQTVSPDRLTEDTQTHTQKDAREMNKEKNETDERQHLDVTCVCGLTDGGGAFVFISRRKLVLILT